MISKLFCGLVSISAIAVALVSSAALAGETRVTGVYAAVPIDPVVITKEDGSSVVMFGVQGFLIVNDKSNPWHGVLMDCSGVGAYAADGAPQMEGGTCMIIDGDGDVQMLPWRRTNARGGIWNVSKGTGKFANMSGSGTYVAVALADGRILNRWTFKQVTP